MSGGVVGIVSSISDPLSIPCKGHWCKWFKFYFWSKNCHGGGGQSAASNNGSPGGSGGGGGRGPTTGGTGSQGGNGGSAFNAKPGGWSAGGGGGAGGNSSNSSLAGAGIVISVPGSPEGVCNGGAPGNGAPDLLTVQVTRDLMDIVMDPVPGAATPGCPTHPTGGGGGETSNAPGKGAGGGGYPQFQFS